MFSTSIVVLCGLAVLVASELNIDVRVCYDATGCEPHVLSCGDRSTQIIIKEAFIGFNCSVTGHVGNLCHGPKCCRSTTDFRCWDVFDIVSIRVLCDSCWRMSSCKTIDLLSPTNRCQNGVHVLPVYSIVRYKCLPKTLDIVDVDDMCYEYQIHPPYPVDNYDTTIATTSQSSSSKQDKMTLTLGIGIPVAIVTIIIIVILLYLILSKRRKPTKNEEGEIKDVSLNQSQYFTLESRRQSRVSNQSNRNSTYYNTVDDLAVSIISVADDNTQFKNKVSTKRRKSSGRRPSEIKGENSNKYDNSPSRKNSSVMNDNSLIRNDNSRSQLSREDSSPIYVNGDYDRLQLTSRVVIDKTDRNRKSSIIEDDGYDHLIRGPINSLHGKGYDDLYSNHKIQSKGK